MNDVKSFEQTVQCAKVSPINAIIFELCIVWTFTCIGFSSVFHRSSLPELIQAKIIVSLTSEFYSSFTHIYSPLATPINLTNLSYFQYDDVCKSHTYTQRYSHWNDEYNVTSIKKQTKQLD